MALLQLVTAGQWVVSTEPPTVTAVIRRQSWPQQASRSQNSRTVATRIVVFQLRFRGQFRVRTLRRNRTVTDILTTLVRHWAECKLCHVVKLSSLYIVFSGMLIRSIKLTLLLQRYGPFLLSYSVFRSTLRSRPNKVGLKCSPGAARPSFHTSVRPQKVSSISMKFGMVEVDEWCTMVCSMARLKVKVTSPWKLEILLFSKAISSAIYNGSWQLATDSQTRAQSTEIALCKRFVKNTVDELATVHEYIRVMTIPRISS